MPIIKEMRVGFLWTLPYALSAFPPSGNDAFYDQFAEFYYQDFEEALTEYAQSLQGMGIGGQWMVPWIHVPRAFFWNRYLNNIDSLSKVRTKDCLKHLAPLARNTLAVALSPTSEPVGLKLSGKLHGFRYPHAISIVVRVWLKGDRSLADMVNAALELWTTGQFDVAWSPADTEQNLTLRQLGASAQARMSNQGDGGARLDIGDPFTVTTVVRGEDFDSSQSIQPGEELHRALAGLCSLRADWASLSLDQSHLDKSRLPSKDHQIIPPGNLLYGSRNGRAVWFPSLFLEDPQRKKTRKLGYYHNNLILASLQTTSLITLMQQAVDLTNVGRQLYVPFIKPVSDTIGRVYGASRRYTYRSWSMRAQIDEPSALASVNDIRAKVGLVPLN